MRSSLLAYPWPVASSEASPIGFIQLPQPQVDSPICEQYFAGSFSGVPSASFFQARLPLFAHCLAGI